MTANEERRTALKRSTAHELALSWRDGREEVVPAGAQETVLDAAERAGVSLPFGCRTGACSTCTGRILDGRIEHGRPPRVLKPRHLEVGTRCCVSPSRGPTVALRSARRDQRLSDNT